MRFFSRTRANEAAGEDPSAPGAPPATDEASPEASTVAGERSTVSVDRARSLQSRVSNMLAIGLMSVLGVGLLGWYYSQVLARQARAQAETQSASEAKTRGEMSLPPLGRIDPPVVERVLGPPPTLPATNQVEPERAGPIDTPAAYDTDAARGRSEKSADEVAHERRLSGDALVSVDTRGSARLSGTAVDRTDAADEREASLSARGPADRPTPVGNSGFDDDGAARIAASGNASDIASLLQPTATPAARASVLPTRRLLLGKGSFLDCTLETAIDSSLPSMTTCLTATDTFGVDGTVVLLPRGTKLFGETRGQVRQGTARVYVLWTEATTPDGVVVPLASPGTDELGRAGLAGKVNRHFWERFGSAILISVIDGAVQAAVQSSQGGDTVIVNSSTSRDIMTEVLRSTLQIRPTVTKNNGDRIAVLVARNLDFRSVYELRPVQDR